MDGITAGTDAVFDEKKASLLDGGDDAPEDPFADLMGLDDSDGSDEDQDLMDSDVSDQEEFDEEEDQFKEDEAPEEPPRKKKKLQESPAPSPTPAAPAAAPASGKYIPPRLRQKMLEASAESNAANPSSAELLRKIRGLLNRVSEGNMARVTTELQGYFATFSRHGM